MKTFLFDADGVVLNSEGFAKQFEKDYPEINEKSISFFKERFADCLRGQSDLVDILSKELPLWGWSGTTEDFLNYWFEAEAHVDEKLLSYIQELRKKGYKCYLATNQESHRLKYILETMKLSSSFDGTFSSCKLGVMKSNEDFFHLVIDTLEGIKKDEILFWDDDKRNISTAESVGIQGKIYSTYEEFRTQMDMLDI